MKDHLMGRPNRNGTCKICGGQVRHYPAVDGAGRGAWAHMDRADWVNQPHDPNPTDESIAAALPAD